MTQNTVINAFFNPDFYDHFVDQIDLIETHISWVFLTGQIAYKIKKPVNFGFLDFSTLEKRHYYCQQELLLNKRFAPDIYLEVLPITQSTDDASANIELNGQGKILDYTVKMKQFDHHFLFDKLIKKNQITLEHIDNLSAVIASFHAQINTAAEDSDFASNHQIMTPVEENFSILRTILSDKNDQQKLDVLHHKTLSMFHSLEPQLMLRKKEGAIRECHGDLHLGNITLSDNKIILFDGIEFNDHLRWIDTMSDCAFLIMDLQDHKQFIFANHFLNSYLFKTGDYSGLSVLAFYLVYRAMIRAKVAGLRLQQQQAESSAYKDTKNELKNYLELTEHYLHCHFHKKKPFLAITYGLSGSGKSSVCRQISDQTGAIIISSDIERKRLFLHSADALYSDDITRKNYLHLIGSCQQVLNAGYSVIIDATFLNKKWRQKFHHIAHKHQFPFHILSCFAEQHILEQRLIIRQSKQNSHSDADVLVMKMQLKKRDKLDSNEQQYIIPVNTQYPLDLAAILLALEKFI